MHVTGGFLHGEVVNVDPQADSRVVALLETRDVTGVATILRARSPALRSVLIPCLDALVARGSFGVLTSPAVRAVTTFTHAPSGYLLVRWGMRRRQLPGFEVAGFTGHGDDSRTRLG